MQQLSFRRRNPDFDFIPEFLKKPDFGRQSHFAVAEPLLSPVVFVGQVRGGEYGAEGGVEGGGHIVKFPDARLQKSSREYATPVCLRV